MRRMTPANPFLSEMQLAMRMARSTRRQEKIVVARPAPARILLEELQRISPPGLAAHHVRVGRMSAALARRLGLDEAAALAIGRAGTLHDIAMALLPEDLLAQTGLLSANEKELVRRHSLWGYEILRLAGDPGLALAAQVALQHHERWDGSGYPSGLAGEQICLAARIVAVCAAYDVLRHPPPGRPALGHEAALSALGEGGFPTRATAFDPTVRDIFVRFQNDFRCIGEGETRLSEAA